MPEPTPMQDLIDRYTKAFERMIEILLGKPKQSDFVLCPDPLPEGAIWSEQPEAQKPGPALEVVLPDITAEDLDAWAETWSQIRQKRQNLTLSALQDQTPTEMPAPTCWARTWSRGLDYDQLTARLGEGHYEPEDDK